MKTAPLVENRKIEIKDKTLSEPIGHEVKVKIISCGICGSDIPRYFDNGARRYPIVLGHEFFGQVIAVGENVTGLNVEDFVVGVPLVPCFECADCAKGDFSLCKNYRFIGSSIDGAFQEEVILPDVNLYRINSSIANKNCALFEPSTVAVHAVRLYEQYQNKTVAVIGGGTIGEFLALWAQIFQAKETVLFVRRHDNDETYKKIGIKEICISDEDGINRAIQKYTEGKGFDIVFDGTGNNATILTALQLAANHANVCLVGTPTTDVKFSKREWETINRKELFLTGTWMSYSNNFPGEEWDITAKALEDKKLLLTDEFFSGIFKLDDINQAFNYIKSGKNGMVGRVLIVME